MGKQSPDLCIYCGAEVPSRGQGDHVIPAALGHFRNAIVFDQICSACNSRIGPCEEQLIRCGPAALFRPTVVSATVRSRGRRRASSIGAGSAPAPKVWAQFPGCEQAALLTNDLGAVRSFDHLVVYDENNTPHAVRLDPSMSSAALRTAVSRLHIKKITKTVGTFDASKREVYRRLFSQAWPEAQYHEGNDLSTGVHQVPVRIDLRVNDLYFRAIAKIAFHYYLTQTPRSSGSEDHFQEIRGFILNGGGHEVADRFFTKAEVFQFPRSLAGAVPSYWHHVLGAAEHNGIVFGFVCLFYGPHFRGERHTLEIAKIASKIVLPKSCWGHTYNYYRPDERKRFNGEVHQIGTIPMG